MPGGSEKDQTLSRGIVKRKIAGKTEKSIVRKRTLGICERHVGVGWQGLLRQSQTGFQTQPIESVSA